MCELQQLTPMQQVNCFLHVLHESLLTIPTVAAIAVPFVMRNLWASAHYKNSMDLMSSMSLFALWLLFLLTFIHDARLVGLSSTVVDHTPRYLGAVCSNPARRFASFLPSIFPLEKLVALCGQCLNLMQSFK